MVVFDVLEARRAASVARMLSGSCPSRACAGRVAATPRGPLTAAITRIPCRRSAARGRGG